MYVVTPFPNDLIAIDLKTPGKRLWTFSPGTSPFAQGKACCDVVNRGPAFASGMIIYAALDDTVMAVNAETGQLVWSTSLGDPRLGQVMTGAPLVIGDLAIVGNSGGEFGVRGWVQALNVKTGATVWKAFNTGSDADVKIGPDFHAFYAKDRGTNLGATTWGGTLWKQGGSTSWGYLTYDPELNLLFHGTSSPGVWNPDMRPGDNKWSATIFARDPTTGNAIWAYQITPHDGYDFDAISENVAVDLPVNGIKKRLLVHFDKNGFAYTLNRKTGEVLNANPYGHVTWSSGVDLATGLPTVKPAFVPHQGVITQDICPTPEGAKEYVPVAFHHEPGYSTCQPSISATACNR
jgi:alcohol dehydrogenase (cytochrome c)